MTWGRGLELIIRDSIQGFPESEEIERVRFERRFVTNLVLIQYLEEAT